MKYKTFSVAQLKNRPRRPWQGILQYKTEDGKWRHKTRVFPEAKGKKDAERLTQEWFNELNAEEDKKAEDTYTLINAVENYMELQLNTKVIQQSSYRNEKNSINRYLRPYEIADIVFMDVERSDLERWITQLHSEGLAQPTIHNIYKTVSKVYVYYYKTEKIDRNPCTLTVPKGNPRQSHMTADQMAKFLKCVNLEFKPEDQEYVAIYLFYYAGLRMQEVCGLRWRDIDLDAGTISITSAVGVGTDGNYMKEPKSRSSYRTFPMVPQLKELLTQLSSKFAPEPSTYVCGNSNTFVSPGSLSSSFKRFRNKYGLVDAFGKPLTSHLLRHNLGYWGARTVDISSLSHILGHASRAMTLNTYGSTDKNAVKMAIDQIGKEFSKISQDFSEEW